MDKVFFVCAALGGTVLVCQFVLALIGFGADDIELADDVPDDVSATGAGHDGYVGDHAAHHHGHHGSTWLFGVISFRTVVSALTFFGLGGYAALKGGQSAGTAVVIALGLGVTAMYAVHWLMQLMYRLGQDRTLKITHAVGQRGTIYIPVPGANAGEGKVQISMQERLVEYAAMTGQPDELPTGARVVVTRIIGPGTVEVEQLSENPESADA